MKKLIALFLICATLCSIFILPASAATTKNITEPAISNANAFWNSKFGATDVKGHWAAYYINGCVVTGIMQGMSATKFEPDSYLTRAQTVQILYNIEKRINANISYGSASSKGFSDVNAADWFFKAVYWAKNANIVNGTDATHFSPNSIVTREQFVSMLYRFNSYKGYANKGLAYNNSLVNLKTFNDYTSVSPYAQTALQWACGNTLVGGTNNRLNPQGYLTRAQVSKIAFVFATVTIGKSSPQVYNGSNSSFAMMHYAPPAQWKLALSQNEYIKNNTVTTTIFDNLDKRPNSKNVYFATTTYSNNKISYKNFRLDNISVSGNVPSTQTLYTVANPSLMHELYFYSISEAILYGISKAQQATGMQGASTTVYILTRSSMTFDGKEDRIDVDIVCTK